eukprot:c1868_g1_i1 orf=129-329(+)
MPAYCRPMAVVSDLQSREQSTRKCYDEDDADVYLCVCIHTPAALGRLLQLFIALATSQANCVYAYN